MKKSVIKKHREKEERGKAKWLNECEWDLSIQMLLECALCLAVQF